MYIKLMIAHHLFLICFSLIIMIIIIIIIIIPKLCQATGQGSTLAAAPWHGQVALETKPVAQVPWTRGTPGPRGPGTHQGPQGRATD